MSLYVPRVTVAAFEEHFFAPETGTYDQEGTHHEFNQGLHGRKIDFDAVKEGTRLYEEWVDVTAADLASRYSKSELGRAVLVGVANGTNRLARDTALALGGGLLALETVKIEKGNIQLSQEAIRMLMAVNPSLVIITEDIATRGTNGSSVVLSTHANRPPGLEEIIVSHTIQRGMPERLAELGIEYHSLITKLLPNYRPEVCRAKGYCADGWDLIKYGQKTHS
ncbi:MAG TPA: hypothetical protein VM124_02650 [Candidatus Limnocylindrales bacterium]|nr:hypothetical protein [Candidatus Limnocylindrales bacterium]